MPYRDDQAALEARRDELRRDLADATRHAAALADAQREKERLTRELAAAEAQIERARSRRLPLLENVRIASPCSASWEAMTGDDRVRFCGSCQKNVYNLSAMESAEAETLLAKHNESICVRLYRRTDGTVMTTDCPVGVRKRRLKRAVLAVAGAGALAASASSLLGRSPERRAMMGAVAALPAEAPATSEPLVPATAQPTAWAMGTAAATTEPAPVPPKITPVMGVAPARPPRPKMGMVKVDF
jgi:hypothetical protein